MLSMSVLISSIVICFVVGVFIFARNPKNFQNRLYGLLTLGFILLAISNYFSLRQDDNQLFFIRSVMASVTFVAACFYFLIRFFDSSNEKKLQFIDIIVLLLTPIVLIIDFTPLLFEGLTQSEPRVPIANYGVFLYVAHLALTFITSLIILVRKSTSSYNHQRSQYKLLLFGVLPVGVWAVTGFIMPMGLSMPQLIILSPVYTAIFVTVVGYAIIKHGLYDIKFFVLRIVTHSLTTAVLAVLYVAPIILGLIYLTGVELSTQQVFGVLLAVTILAVNYNRLRRWFDKVSNRIFYGDSYDAASMLAQLNTMLATTIDIEKILAHTTDIIQQNIKTELCVFIIRSLGTTELRFVGEGLELNEKKTFSQVMGNVFAEEKGDVILTDNVSSSVHRSTLQSLNIGMLLRIRSKSRLLSAKDSEVVLSLGHKKSGKTFDNQDLAVLQSIKNVLAIAIQNALHYEEIQQFNKTLQQKVEEATRKLKQTNEKLRKMDETKDEFISMASHQLRTPLTSVKGYVSMVLDGDVGPITAPQRELLQQSFVSSQRMANLISDMLNLSRINTGKFVIEPSAVYLPSVIESELGQLREIAVNKNINLVFAIPPEFPTLQLDEGKMHQVIMNLIDNALYYTPDGGTVTVELTESATSIEFKVVDTGIGVPREAQKHLFTKMYRAENARRTRPDGTGLGLFMVKKVIIAQGGSIIFESEEGKGSTFGFKFSKNNRQLNTLVTPDKTSETLK